MTADPGLFDEPPHTEPPPAEPTLSADQRRTRRQAADTQDHHPQALTEETTMTEPGKIAYEAYCTSVGGTSVRGEQLPTWEQQSPKLRDAWTAAAEAATADLRGQAQALRETLSDVLGHFTERGHPGRAAWRSSWVDESRISHWHDMFHAVPAAEPRCPRCGEPCPDCTSERDEAIATTYGSSGYASTKRTR